MENATKALLIAAAVLIAIVIIALGIRLVGGSNDTIEIAEAVDKQIGESTKKQGEEVYDALAGLEGYRVDRKYQLGGTYTLYSTKTDEEERKAGDENLMNQVFPNYKISKDSKYEISFDYEFVGDNFDSKVVFWSIGIGYAENQYKLDVKDFLYFYDKKGSIKQTITSQEIDKAITKYNQTFGKNYLTIQEAENVYFAFRLPRIARITEKGKYAEYTVKISNLLIKYK